RTGFRRRVWAGFWWLPSRCRRSPPTVSGTKSPSRTCGGSGNRSARNPRSTTVFGMRSRPLRLWPARECARWHGVRPPSSSSGCSTRATLKGISMDAEIGRPGSPAGGTDPRAGPRRLSTETKSAYKTTEFLTYVVVFAGILVASFLVKTGQDGQRIDYFRADNAWWYITLLTIGYMIARGLAKSGSREPYDDDRRQTLTGGGG